MRRAGYLAALGGGAARTAAPSLRPPSRLFPPEPLSLEMPVARRAVVEPPGERTGVPAPERGEARPPTVARDRAPARAPAARARADSARIEPAGTEPAPSAAPSSTGSPAVALEPPGAEPVALRLPSPPELASPSRPVAERPAARRSPEPLAPPAGPRLAAARPAERPPEPGSESREPAALAPPGTEPSPAPHSPVALEPLRRRHEPVEVPPSPRPVSRPGRHDPGVAQVHIGTIEVTVVPPPPPEPASAPSFPPVAAAPRARSTFVPRPAGSGRWFGLAQR